MRRLLPLLFLLLLGGSDAASSASAQINTLTIPDSVEVGHKLVAVCNCVVPDGGKLTILWNASSGLETVQVDNQLFIWGTPGKYTIDAVVIPLQSITVDGQTFDVIAGQILRLDARFKITGSVTPEPDPEPDPDPDPITDAPFPSPGFAAIVIYETQETGKLPASQSGILNSAQVKQYLNSRCAKIDGPDGKQTYAWRMWDDDYTDAQLANSPDVMRTAYRAVLSQAGGKLPWIAVSDGKTGFSGPLPTNVADTMALLKKYGG